MTSGQVWAIIKKLEDDKQALKQISSELKEVGETIINYSISFQNISDLLFEGYSVDGKRIDEKMPEYVEEYKRYGNEILSLIDMIDGEVKRIEQELVNKRNLYQKLKNEEKIKGN